MYLFIDHYDSFVYNLVSYFHELGEETVVVRNDQMTASQMEEKITKEKLEGVILSPGPKGPEECGESIELVNRMEGKVPILGVCLGHQILVCAIGGNIKKGRRPMHGKVTEIQTNGRGLFQGLPKEILVTRYHSLEADPDTFPKDLRVDAKDENGTIMAVSHNQYPIYGIQFHPEAVLTQYGHEVLAAFIENSKQWWRKNENSSL